MKPNQHDTIPLWPDGAPGSETWPQAEEETAFPDGMRLVRNVTQPSLTVYPATNPNGTAVIVAPGGAYHFLAIEHEGRQVAEWLAARGITAFVLKYRVLRTGNDVAQEVDDFLSHRVNKEPEMRELLAMTLADAEQAVRIVRRRAGEWGIRLDRIGFMGFSAGGGVTIQAVLDAAQDARPDFAAPIYPAVFDEVHAPADAPPLFLLCAQDDEMASQANLLLYKAWKAANRPVEMHIYAAGGHGFGMNRLGLPSDTWVERFGDWLAAMKLV